MDYMPTNLEMEIEKELKRLHVRSPLQLLDVETIADEYNILLKAHKGPSISGIFSGIKIIKIDSRLHSFLQRQQFFHELGHVLHHYGDQQELPESFKDLQEYRARNFAFHFAVPTFMLHKIDFLKYRSETVDMIANTFQVTIDFANERLKHYENQVNGALFQKEFEKLVSLPPVVNEEPKTIDIYGDLPFWEQPDFKTFIEGLRKTGFREEEIRNIVNQIKRKEANAQSHHIITY
ncbi:protein of unknown function [Gracilibacillus orientalis]|uniref:IrrE N-terminal-like domain-containing protein n=1 Tax=Gracilibacillus orientalis TaxID=334253 RepID=A0A1I4PLK5_9BACI|nr:ImmA/IrrE family metallo-endopeptidase [Gracilibacillus orientalis]SFM28486.1 protein of unknown function [Gracilibacillus orientalis]